MDATELLLSDFRAKVDGYLASTEIKRIRNKLSLTQKSASSIFGGGHNAFSRYETGRARQSKATDNLLRLLDKHPHLLNEIQEEKEETAA
jgi:HTH-type transcriptional regulator/antitoxin MqsA